MTDIPGTITTAIREAIDAAVVAERDRCSKAVADEIAKWNCGHEYYANVTEACESIAANIRAIPVEIAGPRQLTVAECNLLTEEFGVGWILEGFPQRDAVVTRIERMVKESIGCSDPEPDGQHFDISVGTFVSNTRG